MRVSFVSTYTPDECGIATYTSYLAPELKELNNEIYIISQTGGCGEKVFPSFSSTDPDLAEKVFEALIKFTPDIVHIQHEYGLFGKDSGVNVIPLLYKLRMAGIPTVVTLHTVYETFTKPQEIICGGILNSADAVIVHQEFQKKALAENIRATAKIHVIPHGVRMIEPVPEAKGKLGLSGKKVVLIAGYFRPTKGYDRIVKIFPEIMKEVPEACLLIAGKARMQEYSQYRDYFLKLIEDSPAKDSILILRGQFPQKTFDAIISAADVSPMPYLLGAQSGIMAHCFAFAKPVVASPLPAFIEAITRIKGGLIADTNEEFADAIIRLLKDEKLYGETSQNIRNYVKNHLNWMKVAEETVKVYQEIVKVPYGKARYLEI